jgi:uncharacterized protein (DUF2062 family)
MTDEPHNQRQLRFARIRRAKFWLRFMPRRARFHTYPVVGRFASFARKRSYLWSFQYPQIRPAFYLGSVLTLLPVIGQLPIAFVLCLSFRTNFMILGGLQFVSNLLTLPFLLAGCYQLGRTVMDFTGLDRLAGLLPPAAPPDAALGPAPALAEPGFASKFFLYGSALTIGALIAGLLLGAALDLLWRLLVLPAARHRAAKKPVTALVTPHDDSDGSRPPYPPAS